MLAKDFIHRIATGEITRVTICRPDIMSAWSVCGYGDRLAPDTPNAITLDERGSRRVWADVGAAYDFVRKSGYRQPIEIEG